MKRFRCLTFHLDSNPAMLSMEIKEDWDEEVKILHMQGKRQIVDHLINKYGSSDQESKQRNYKDTGNLPISILAYHNKFMYQIRSAFIIGAYYPALTATVALGERILNHLVLALREDYSSTPEFKFVRNKQSLNDWTRLINTLYSWSILLPESKKAFESLRNLRNNTLHFRPEVDSNDRAIALEAISLMNQIISGQFTGFGSAPWFITKIPGEVYIKKEYENNPFVKKIYLPNCALTGPYHKIDFNGVQWVIFDKEYPTTQEITDEEFIALRLKDNW